MAAVGIKGLMRSLTYLLTYFEPWRPYGHCSLGHLSVPIHVTKSTRSTTPGNSHRRRSTRRSCCLVCGILVVMREIPATAEHRGIPSNECRPWVANHRNWLINHLLWWQYICLHIYTAILSLVNGLDPWSNWLSLSETKIRLALLFGSIYQHSTFVQTAGLFPCLLLEITLFNTAQNVKKCKAVSFTLRHSLQ